MGAGETVGGLSRKGASLLGLPQGVPVINGSLDSATETFGAMVINPGEYIIRIGTAGGIHVIKAEPRPQVKLLTYPYLIDGLWYSQAGHQLSRFGYCLGLECGRPGAGAEAIPKVGRAGLSGTRRLRWAVVPPLSVRGAHPILEFGASRDF